MSIINIVEKCLHTTVLCLESYFNYILAGIGSSLLIYQNNSLQCRKRIFTSERVHSIILKNDLILLKGGKELALASLKISSGDLECQILSKIKCSDWIQDVIFLNEDLIGLTTAHNSFQLWKLLSKECLKTSSCLEKCIIYSCKIIGDSDKNIAVFSGTVFGEVLIWSPFLEDNLLLQRLQAHNGAVFSVTVDILKGILCTTSDDRSLKVWTISLDKPILLVEDWKNSKIQLSYTLFGHTARVWKSLIISDFYITAGEDSKLIVWNKNGTLLKVLSLHQESGIRALHFSKELNAVTTGGEDGGINIIPFHFLNADVQLQKVLSLNHKFSTRVCLTKNGLVYSQNGGCVFVSKTGEHVHHNKNFENYSVLEKSPSEDFIILGSIKGHLCVINIKTNEVVIDDLFLDGRVYCIHWLNGSILTCGPKGRLDLWKFTEKNISNLKNLKTMILPECKERWTTCASVVDNGNIIVGDRMGSLHIFSLTGGSDPVYSFRKIHSYLGVSDIKFINNTILTIGRDGTLKTFQDSTHTLTHKLPIEWPWKIVPYRNDILILGFQGVSFVIWSMKHNEIIRTLDCGGGHRSCDFELHQGSLRFICIKDKKIFSAEISLDEIKRVENGYHGKEINCLKSLPTNPEVVVSGSEDTTVRISKIWKQQFLEIKVLKTHISSVRAIAICSVDSHEFLIVSAGGKGQIIVWFYDVIADACREMVNHFLRQETRNWKNPVPEIDPNIRFMCVDVIKLENKFWIVTGCSDCQIRLFSFKEKLILLAEINYTHCILNIKIFKIDKSLFVVSMGTDGRVVFWDITNSSNVSCLRSFNLHQSGINSFQFDNLEIKKFILATGGDDNMLRVSLVQFSKNEIELCEKWENNRVHSCQISGIKIFKNIMLTTSIDQRITVWKWSLNEDDTIRMKFFNQYFSSVPDIHGIEASWHSKDVLLVWVFGNGVEAVEINISSEEKDCV